MGRVFEASNVSFSFLFSKPPCLLKLSDLQKNSKFLALSRSDSPTDAHKS